MSPRDLPRGVRARAAYLARITAEDATELAAVFWQVARRQARDAAVDAGPCLLRVAQRARRAATPRR
jgi:hypothetical protein